MQRRVAHRRDARGLGAALLWSAIEAPLELEDLGRAAQAFADVNAQVEVEAHSIASPR